MVFVLIEFIRCCNLSYNLKTCIFYALLMIRLTLPNLPMKYGSWLLDLKKWQRRLQMCDPGFLIIHAVTRYPIFRFSSSMMMMMMMFWRLDDLHTKDVFFFFPSWFPGGQQISQVGRGAQWFGGISLVQRVPGGTEKVEAGEISGDQSDQSLFESKSSAEVKIQRFFYKRWIHVDSC